MRIEIFWWHALSYINKPKYFALYTYSDFLVLEKYKKYLFKETYIRLFVKYLKCIFILKLLVIYYLVSMFLQIFKKEFSIKTKRF